MGSKTESINLLFFLLVCFAIVLRLIDMPRPYADGNLKSDCIASGQFMIARNYLRYGYLKTKCLQILNAQPASPKNWVYYLNHPAGFPLVQSLAFRLYCPCFVAAKLLPSIAFILQLVFLFRIGKALYGKTAGWASLALYSLFQMSLLFANNPNYESFCLLFILAFAERCLKGKHLQAGIVLFLGGLVDYVSLYPGPIMALMLLAKRKGDGAMPLSKAIRITIFWGLLSLLSLGLVFFHASLSPTNTGFLDYVKGLLSNDTMLFKKAVNFTWPNFLKSQLSYFVQGFGISGFAIFMASLFFLKWNRIFSLLLFTGLFHILVFRFHAHVHFFWGIYLTPAFSLGIGCLASRLSDMGERKRIYSILSSLMVAVVCAEGAYRFIERRASVDHDKPERWARVLNEHLPENSAAILVGANIPPFWCVEFFTNDIPVRESSLNSDFDFKLAAEILKKYGFKNKRIVAVVSESDMKAIDKVFGPGKARGFMEKGLRKGRYLGKTPKEPPLPVLHFWDLTETFRKYF